MASYLIRLSVLSYFAASCLIALRLDAAGQPVLLAVAGCFTLIGLSLAILSHIPSELPTPPLAENA